MPLKEESGLTSIHNMRIGGRCPEWYSLLEQTMRIWEYQEMFWLQVNNRLVGFGMGALGSSMGHRGPAY